MSYSRCCLGLYKHLVRKLVILKSFWEWQSSPLSRSCGLSYVLEQHSVIKWSKLALSWVFLSSPRCQKNILISIVWRLALSLLYPILSLIIIIRFCSLLLFLFSLLPPSPPQPTTFLSLPLQSLLTFLSFVWSFSSFLHATVLLGDPLPMFSHFSLHPVRRWWLRLRGTITW